MSHESRLIGPTLIDHEKVPEETERPYSFINELLENAGVKCYFSVERDWFLVNILSWNTKIITVKNFITVGATIDVHFKSEHVISSSKFFDNTDNNLSSSAAVMVVGNYKTMNGLGLIITWFIEATSCWWPSTSPFRVTSLPLIRDAKEGA